MKKSVISLPPKTVVFVVGPTATGKTKLGIKLAEQFNGEIISADSMQVYKGMDIGTAKPTRAERKAVRHHLIDTVSPAQNFSVYHFHKKALQLIQQIITRKKVPIVVGGTGLYVRSLLEGLSDQPAANRIIRKRLEKEAAEKGLEGLYQRLSKMDPETASRIKPADQRRIIRALEILQLSGKTPSEIYRSKISLVARGYHPLMIGLTKDRQKLYEDIEKRVDQMFRKGLVREALRLEQKRISKTAAQAVGYKEIWQAYLAAGKNLQKLMASIPQVKLLIKRNTRRFAKRQITWFRREKNVIWVDACDSSTLLPMLTRA